MFYKREDLESYADEDLKKMLEQYQTTLDNNTENLTNNVCQIIESAIGVPMECLDFNDYDTRITLRRKGDDWSNKYIFHLDRCSRARNHDEMENNNGFYMDSPYTTGSIDMHDRTSRHFIYYTTYGMLITNEPMLNEIESALRSYAEENKELRANSTLISMILSCREVERKNAADLRQRVEYFETMEAELLKPENSEKWVMGYPNERKDYKSGITYRNKPFFIKKSVEGQWLFDTEEDYTNMMYRSGKENHDIFRYTTAVQIRQLKSDKTGKWLNRTK